MTRLVFVERARKCWLSRLGAVQQHPMKAESDVLEVYRHVGWSGRDHPVPFRGASALH